MTDSAASSTCMLLPPRVYMIPNDQISEMTWAYRINNDGDVLGCYAVDATHRGWYLYSPGFYGNAASAPVDLGVITPSGLLKLGDRIPDVGPVVAGQDEFGIFRLALWVSPLPQYVPADLEPNDPAKTVVLDWVCEMNGDGTFGGECWISVTSKGRTTTVVAPYVFRLNDRYMTFAAGVKGVRRCPFMPPYGINNNEDAVTGSAVGSTLTLYHAAWIDPLNLNDLVMGTTSDLTIWLNSLRRVCDTTDRVDASGLTRDKLESCHFGKISGEAGNLGYLLTPQPLP